MGKLIRFMLVASIFACCINSNNVYAETLNMQSSGGCAVNMDVGIANEFYNDENHLVRVYENGIEAEYYDDGSVLIKDYNHVLNSTTPTVQQRGWVAIGIAIIKWVGKAAATCGTIEYIRGHDICRIVINSIIAPNNDNTLRYELTGNFVSGYIPGCEPAHSSPCNAGYWEYRVIPQ